MWKLINIFLPHPFIQVLLSLDGGSGELPLVHIEGEKALETIPDAPLGLKRTCIVELIPLLFYLKENNKTED